MSWYLDASAIVKLVASEDESSHLHEAMAASHQDFFTSSLSLTEVRRGARRKGLEELAEAERVLAKLDLVPMSTELLVAAGHLEPTLLRSLDAIHIASAMVIRPELSALVTYDSRMREAAEAHGITVLAPGQTC